MDDIEHVKKIFNMFTCGAILCVFTIGVGVATFKSGYQFSIYVLWFFSLLILGICIFGMIKFGYRWYVLEFSVNLPAPRIVYPPPVLQDAVYPPIIPSPPSYQSIQIYSPPENIGITFHPSDYK